MNFNKSGDASRARPGKHFWILLGCLGVIFGAFFFKSFLPQYVLHNNDTPLGALDAAAARLPALISGCWVDLNWVGFEGPAAPPDASTFFRWLAGAVGYAKFWTPLAQIILGLCAWVFFRSLKLSPFACLLGGLAAALHSDFLSNACWGQQSRPLALAAVMLALAAMQARGGWRGWARVLLGAAAVGWGIMEGFDVAAMFSVVAGMYVLLQPSAEEFLVPSGFERSFIICVMNVGFIAALIFIAPMVSSVVGVSALLIRVCIGAVAVVWNYSFLANSPTLNRLAFGASRASVLAGFSALVAAQFIVGLVNTQIKGVAGAQGDTQSKAERWDWATQWSMAKIETLGFIVPGLFGYRMDTPQGLPEDLQKDYVGGQYWGSMGRDAVWDKYFESGKTSPPGQGFLRHSGGGSYAGPLLMTVVLMALLQSLRGKNSPFTPAQRRWVWFWSGLAVGSLLLAWGKHAPFFKPIYYLVPMANVVRSPGKFVLIWDWAMLVLFAYGVHALAKKYLEPAPAATKANWWSAAPSFDRKWVVGSVAVFGAGVLAWLIYSSSAAALRRHLEFVMFDPNTAADIARFSISRVGWFVFFLALGLGALLLVVQRKFAGVNAKWGVALLGAVLVLDLAHANRPWIIYWDYTKKYATNDVLEFLRKDAHEHRAVGIPPWLLDAFQFDERLRGTEQYLDQLYRIEWAQHHFQSMDIQSLDVVQMSRPPEDFVAYESALAVHSGATLPLVTRKWELTNTRYILAHSALVDFFNKQFDPGKERYRAALRFDITPKPGVDRPRMLEDLTAVTNANGAYALVEFTDALPRAKLYSHWQSGVADTNALTTLGDLQFNPAQTVLVAEPIPAAATNDAPGTVEFTSYAPKHIKLKAKASAPSVLLLNDRYAAAWQVRVDGQPTQLLRCNYLMRGAQVPAGEHTVEFIFQPDIKPLYLTCAGLAVTLLVGLGLLIASRRTEATKA